MKLTLEQFIDLIYSENKLIYVYEEEPTIVDEKGEYDFSNMEIFLAYRSSLSTHCVLRPEICHRTISQIHFINNTIRVVLEDEQIGSKGTADEM